MLNIAESVEIIVERYGENNFGLSLSPETEIPSTEVEVNRKMLKGIKGCVVKLDNVIVL